MTKRFYFTTPQQLKEIEAFAKDGSVMNVARVWSVAKRKSDKTAWDGKIGVSFFTEGRERLAVVFRIAFGDELKEIAKLKYLRTGSQLDRPLCRDIGGDNK